LSVPYNENLKLGVASRSYTLAVDPSNSAQQHSVDGDMDHVDMPFTVDPGDDYGWEMTRIERRWQLEVNKTGGQDR
jgi:hypothetical protein